MKIRTNSKAIKFLLEEESKLWDRFELLQESDVSQEEVSAAGIQWRTVYRLIKDMTGKSTYDIRCGLDK